MEKRVARALGGIAAAKVVKQKHIDAYLLNPNYCLFCGKAVEIGNNRVSDVKRKKFCNRKCFASFRNKDIGHTLKEERMTRPRIFGVNENVEIASLYGIGPSKYALIRGKARAKMNFYQVKRECFVCGYTNYVEVHHKKSCNSFSDNSLLSEVNDLNNLVYLCPNHHFEADKGILKF